MNNEWWDQGDCDALVFPKICTAEIQCLKLWVNLEKWFSKQENQKTLQIDFLKHDMLCVLGEYGFFFLFQLNMWHNTLFCWKLSHNEKKYDLVLHRPWFCFQLHLSCPMLNKLFNVCEPRSSLQKAENGCLCLKCLVSTGIRGLSPL